MLYDGITVYTSLTPLENADNPITLCVFHTGSDRALFDMLEKLRHMSAVNEMFVFTSTYDFARINRSAFPFATFVEFSSGFSRLRAFDFALNECRTEYFLFLDTSYDLLFIDTDAVLKVFQYDERAVCASPFLYTNVNVLFPTCIAPKISRDNRVDSISVCPGGTLSSTLYPFLLIGMYKKANMVFYKKDEKRIKNFDVRLYDVFAHLWMMNYRAYIVSFFSVKSNIEFVPITDRTVTKEVKILSARLLSFYKPKGAKCGLKPFWWLGHSAYTVVKDTLPFLKKVVVDFYTLVKRWRFSPMGTNDLF